MTDNTQETIDKLMGDLKQWRDELNLQMHLGKAEAKDLWDETEEKWQHLRSQLDSIENETSDAAKDVGAASMLLVEEIKQGYERLKKMVK